MHALVVAALLVAGGVLVWYLSKDPVNSREIELYCDQVGAKLCGDPKAAYEALDRITEKATERQAKWSGYPTRTERLAQMQELIARAHQPRLEP